VPPVEVSVLAYLPAGHCTCVLEPVNAELHVVPSMEAQYPRLARVQPVPPDVVAVPVPAAQEANVHAPFVE